MLVLFGAPVAHEDDPERAVRAGLRMQQTMARFAQQSSLERAAADAHRHQHRRGAGRHAGRHRLHGDGRRREHRVAPAVGSASRRRAGGRGHVRAHVAHIHYEPAGELQPRGREQSISTWLAVDTLAPPGVTPAAQRPAPRGSRSRAGHRPRGIELALGSDRSLVLHVRGESGVGKSRLIDELLATLDDLRQARCTVLEGACVPYGESERVVARSPRRSPPTSTSTPTLSADQIRERASPRPRGCWRAMFTATDGLHPEVERSADVFLHLLGYPSRIDGSTPAQRDVVTSRAHCRGCSRLRSDVRPMVLSIDDLHWADQVLLELLEHLVASVTRVPFVLVTSMRPGSEVEWPPHQRPHHHRVAERAAARPCRHRRARSELLGECDEAATDQRCSPRCSTAAAATRCSCIELARVVADRRPVERAARLAAHAHRRAARSADAASSDRCSRTPPCSARRARSVARAVRRGDAPAVRPRRAQRARRDGLARGARPEVASSAATRCATPPTRRSPRPRVRSATPASQGLDRRALTHGARRPRPPHGHRRRAGARARSASTACRRASAPMPSATSPLRPSAPSTRAASA